MRVKLELIVDVGETPRADAISYMIEQYGEAEEPKSTLDAVETALVDVLSGGLNDQNCYTGQLWVVESAHIEELQEQG